ncbi:hypothetical protein ABEB36_006762 [Hypothenemus hampei]|uniref:F-box domain-containing protein n=1 Tax=Hypothenemus hampei TaxID=57062 RepID=A0ABD1ERQ1_HYPHA
MPRSTEIRFNVVHFSGVCNNRIRHEGPSGLVPNYRIPAEELSLKKYGTHWCVNSAAKRSYSDASEDIIETDEFVVLEYSKAMIPRHLIIHPSSNLQGAIIQVWGGRRNTTDLDKLVCMPNGNYWNLLWSGNEIENFMYMKRVIPLNKTNYAVNVIKIQLLTSILPYYPRIGNIQLTNKKSVPCSKRYTRLMLQYLAFLPKVVKNHSDLEIPSQTTNIAALPTEILLKIFQYLDTKSLRSCSMVNEHWQQVANDPSLYKYLDLSDYWNIVDLESLTFVANNFNRIIKLDLSNCNGELIGFTKRTNGMDLAIQKILNNCKHSLTHLCLDNNLSVTNNVIKAITQCSNLKELRLSNTFSWNHFEDVQFEKLQTLDVSATHIRTNDLCNILKKTPELLNLLIDSNPQMSKGFANIVCTVTRYNLNLICWSSSKTFLGNQNFQFYRRFCLLHKLEELNLGYCPPTHIPSDLFREIGLGCPRLRRLILAKWENLSVESIAYAVIHCQSLDELDLRCCHKLTPNMCRAIIFGLKKLHLLDVTHCEQITLEEYFDIRLHSGRAYVKGHMEDPCFQ